MRRCLAGGVVIKFFKFDVQGTSENDTKELCEANAEADRAEDYKLLPEDISKGINASLMKKIRNLGLN